MDEIEYSGWRCARLVSDNVEALVTLDVGPRVIRLGLIDGPNQFFEDPAERGLKGGDTYRRYGGHRLWIAPESREVTYYPENDPVVGGFEGDWLALRSAPDSRGLQRELRMRAEGAGGFSLEHRIHHVGTLPVTFAPWALSVMRAGGEGIFPQEPYVPHAENFLPVRPLVLWSYTKMTDPRWTWGEKLVRLRQQVAGHPQKVGAFVRPGWAAYRNESAIFIKRFQAREGGTYPDCGCNFETYTSDFMLELESLGTLETVHPGDYASLRESWRLVVSTLPNDEEGLAQELESLAQNCPALCSGNCPVQ